jgi:hypothetical protein
VDDGRLQVDCRNMDLPGSGPLHHRLALRVNTKLIVVDEVGVGLLRRISQGGIEMLDELARRAGSPSRLQ